MNKKLKKYLDETGKTNAKIAELQEYLKSVQAAQKKEEDGEIIRSIRSMKLGPKALYELLDGLQDGTLTIQQEQVQQPASVDGTKSPRNTKTEEEMED